MKQCVLALCAVLSMVVVGCGGDDKPDPVEDCALAGDEDGNGAADCDDLACAAGCQPVCGNRRLEAGEACEDGNTMDGDGCDSNCSRTACGNGIRSMNEGCDDGNTMSGDGCDSNCMASGCGNSIKNADEECEDGNTTSGDGCDNNCTYTRCGNGVMTTGEGCDDGNASDGDGCDRNCTVTACGNGIKTGTEVCDDGNTVNGDGCDNNCTATACGNGVASTGEGCDDGNATNGDGCDSNCTLTGCGNGIATTGEVCDDGDAENGDGCDVNCTASACGNSVVAPTEGCDDGNATNGDGCDSNCTVTACGNGIKTTGEVCDDGNAANGDGCDSNCTVSACGNSAVAPGEECDDGNATELDGCSAACVLEPLEKEPNEDGSPSMGGFETNGNDFGTAHADANGAFTRSVVIRGALSLAGDEDVYLFRNTSAQVQTIHLDIWNRALGFGVPCGATMDTALHVRDATGASLVANDDRDGATDFCSSLTFGLRPGESAYAHVSELGDNSTISGYVLQATYRAAVCGDGTVSPGEMCEDGNAADGDGCSAQCLLEIRPEREPNNTLPDASTSPVQITGDTTIVGTIKPIADVDTYRLAVATPTVVRFETLTSLYDCTTAAIDVRLFDSSGAPVISDTVGSGINACGAIVVFLEAGTYFVGVERRGNNAIVADYLLQVDFQTSRNSESEPAMAKGFNDTVTTADRMLAGGNNVYVLGDHQDFDDIDVYQISVPPGARIRAEIVEGDRATETCESNGIDSRLTLFDQNGVQLADDDDAGRGFCSMIDGSGTVSLDPAARNTSGAPQTYYLMVQPSTLATTAGGTFVYRLQVTFH